MDTLRNLRKLCFITGLAVGTVCFPTVTYGQSATEQRVCRQGGQYAVFARQPILAGESGRSGSLPDAWNVQRAHEHIFFCSEGRITDNIGFGVGKPDIPGVPITGTGARFSYSSGEIRSGTAADGTRIDTFNLIDNRRYDPQIIKQVIEFRPDSCQLQNDGRFIGIINNCQYWTARVREEYWKRIFVGTWEAQTPDNRWQMQVTWNSAAKRYEGVLTKQGQASQYVGFSIGELVWTATINNQSASASIQASQMYRSGENGVSNGFQWLTTVVDIDASTADILVQLAPPRLGMSGITIFHRVDRR